MTGSPLRSPLLYSGALIWALAGAAWGVLWVLDRSQAWAAAATLVAFLAAGKIVGITAGLALGGHPVLVGLAVFVPDFGAIVFFHPLSQVGIDRLGKWSRFLGDAMAKARERHARGEGMIAKHGTWGLFLVALVPIGFYSPLVVAALGQLGGLRPRAVIGAVGGAIAIMTTVWVATLNAGFRQAAAVDPRLPFVVGMALTLLLVGKSFLAWAWQRGKRVPTPLPEPVPIPAPDAE